MNTPNNLKRFLRDSVFYPCSDFDPTPVTFLAKRYRSFVYADYRISRAECEEKARSRRFPGYTCASFEEMDAQQVCGSSWEHIEETQKELMAELPFEWRDPYVALVRFQRLPEFSKDHGPASFDLMFVRCEATITYGAIFSRLGVLPSCMAYIQPGLGKGGNFPGFPKLLGDALRQHPGGLPHFLLYDELAGKESRADCLDLVTKYTPVDEWDYEKEYCGTKHLTFAELTCPRNTGPGRK